MKQNLRNKIVRLYMATKDVIFIIFMFVMIGVIGFTFGYMKGQKDTTLEFKKIMGNKPNVVYIRDETEGTEEPEPTEIEQPETETQEPETETEEEPEVEPQEVDVVQQSAEEPKSKFDFTDEQLELFALLVYTESGNQPMIGMQYVADVVLNRMEHPDFPDTLEGVIYQKNQFSVVWDGAFDRKRNEVSDEARQAVAMELENRQNKGILYFSATPQPVNGKDAFKCYDVWFSY